jgi:hypothetical protein
MSKYCFIFAPMFNQTHTHTMEVKKIQKFILENPKLTSKEISNKLGIKMNRVAGNRAALKRSGRLKVSDLSKISTQKRKRKLSNKDLKDLVLKLGKKNLHYKEIAKQSGASMATIYRWLGKSKKTKNTYTNENGIYKEMARNKMAKYIVDSDVVGLVPTLPHIACTIEKKILLEEPNYTFLGVECDKPTYNALRKTVRTEKLPITTHYGKISNVIYGEIEGVYAHLILDYCGMLPTFSKELEYAINNKIVKRGGIIAMTFAKPIRGTDSISKYIMDLGGTITNNPNDNRCASDKATEAYFNRIIGSEFDFVEIFNYADDKGNGIGCPMTLIILRRK